MPTAAAAAESTRRITGVSGFSQLILTDYFDDTLNRPVETAIIMPISEISCSSFPLAKVVVNRPQALPPSFSVAVAAPGVSRPAPDQVSAIVSAPAQALPPAFAAASHAPPQVETRPADFRVAATGRSEKHVRKHLTMPCISRLVIASRSFLLATIFVAPAS